MGHHIDVNGKFQSDKHPELPPDKIILSFKDPAARQGLRMFAAVTGDQELAADIIERLGTIEALPDVESP